MFWTKMCRTKINHTIIPSLTLSLTRNYCIQVVDKTIKNESTSQLSERNFIIFIQLFFFVLLAFPKQTNSSIVVASFDFYTPESRVYCVWVLDSFANVYVSTQIYCRTVCSSVGRCCENFISMEFHRLIAVPDSSTAFSFSRFFFLCCFSLVTELKFLHFALLCLKRTTTF